MYLNNRRAGLKGPIVISIAALFMLSIGAAGAAGDFKLTSEMNVDGTIRLTWTSLDDPALHHYNIYWDTEKFDVVKGDMPNAGETGTNYPPLDLENDVKHYFIVTAVDDNGTILAQDGADGTPLESHLKIVNYWNLMAVFWLTTIVFLYVVWKIPTWTKKHQGGA